ncbi:hypothetical protein V6N12_064587 [Hibiscus sabdariffa]|uniref:Uncharacterized protein n=1 Tax=Hibiscus sabdariffa TaxID=183260 RepID=A0ABR2G684_9ROSI
MTICFEWSVYREGSQFQCSTGLLYMDSVTASMKRLAYAKVVAPGKAKQIRPVARVVSSHAHGGSCNQYVVLTDVTEAVVVASTVASVGDVTGSDAVGVGLNPSASTAVDFASIDVGVISTDIEAVVNAV